jgi:hypothetical protein
MNKTNYGLQVQLGNNRWVTYCGVWDVHSLLEATHYVEQWNPPKESKTGSFYKGYRVADLVKGNYSPVTFTKV